MMVYINSDGVRIMKHYDSLNDFNKEWEDYEEPKKYWFIDAYGNIVQNEITKHYGDEYIDMTDAYENQKQIGNYFETNEEAEKAVEKLKAWKRLKDKGFKFQFWTSAYSGDTISFFIDWINSDSKNEVVKDLDLLFSGDEK